MSLDTLDLEDTIIDQPGIYAEGYPAEELDAAADLATLRANSEKAQADVAARLKALQDQSNQNDSGSHLMNACHGFVSPAETKDMPLDTALRLIRAHEIAELSNDSEAA